MNVTNRVNCSFPVNQGQNQNVTAQNVRLLKYGRYVRLKDTQQIAIPQNSILVFNGKYKLDLGANKIQSALSKLGAGESLIIGRKDINPEDITISRQQFRLFMNKGNLYIANMSQYGTSFMVAQKPLNIDNRAQMNQTYSRQNSAVNYDPKYLTETYGNKNTDYIRLFESKYNKLRIANYSYESTFRNFSPEAVKTAITREPERGYCHYENGWIYRFFGNQYRAQNSSDRISLNVQADSRLIKELDDLIIKGQYTDLQGKRHVLSEETRNNVIYKVPQNPNKWAKRHDPITMYFSGPINQNFLQAVSDISQKYARPSCNGTALIGALAGKPWIGVEKEPVESDLLKIVQKMDKINPKLSYAMKQYCYKKWTHTDGFQNFRCSAGKFEAVRIAANEYVAYLRLCQNR